MFDWDVWLRLVVFLAAGLITPGPNVMLILGSSVNFGIKRTIPHWLGVLVGTVGIFLAVGFGLASLFALYPPLKLAVQVLGVLYLAYLAYKIATASGLNEREAGAPITFSQAVLMQAVNVKLIGLAASLVASYAILSDPVGNAFVVALTAAAINGPCLAIWAVFGVGMKKILRRPVFLRAFNLSLAILIGLTLIPLILDIWKALGHGV